MSTIDKTEDGELSKYLDYIAEDEEAEISDYQKRKILELSKQYATTKAEQLTKEAEYNMLKKYADKASKEYTWQEVDNWTFAFGDMLRSEYIKRESPNV